MKAVATDDGANQRPPSLLEGFMAADSRTVIQENIHVILGHGWFQRWVLLCTFVSLTVVVMHAFAYRIIGRPVDHWCQPPEELRHLSPQEWRNVAIPVLPDGSFSQCTVYDPPFPEQEQRREVSCEHWDYDIKNPQDSIVSSWDLVCGRRWLYSFSLLIYIAGPLLFTPLVGIASDRMGRRPTLMACAICLLIATMAAGTSQSFVVFLVARFFISTTSSAAHLLVFILLYEVTGNDKRPLYILLATSIGDVLAQMLMFFLLTLQPRWFLAQALFASASMLLVIWCYSLTESPVWLLDTGSVRPAEKILLWAAETNGLDMTKVKATFKVLKTTIGKRESPPTNLSTMTEGKQNVAAFRRRAASSLASWFGVSFVFFGSNLSHGMLPGIGIVFDFVLQGILLFAAYDCIMKRGLRTALSSVLAFLCVCSAGSTLSAEWRTSAQFPLEKLLVDSTAAVAMSLNIGYTAEVFPTMLRSVGLCISYSVGRAGALLAIYIDHISSGDSKRTLNVFITVMAFISLVAVQWLPEIFIEKQASAELKALSEEQRKEALRASLAQGQVEASSSHPRKPRRHRKKKGSGVESTMSPASPASLASPTSPASGESLASPIFRAS